MKSWQLMDYVVGQRRIRGRHFPVAIAIASRFNARDGYARPSIAKIAEDARVSIATVKRSILALEKLGELQIDRHGKSANRYAFPMAQGEQGRAVRAALEKVMAQPNYSRYPARLKQSLLSKAIDRARDGVAKRVREDVLRGRAVLAR